MNPLTRLFDRVLRIHPEDHVSPGVAANFKHNVFANTLDLMFFFFSDSIWSINTIMPVFAATLTDSPFLIGLIPAVVNAGWFIPQLFMSGRISKMPKVLPFSLRMGFLERMPYMLLPLLTLLIGKLENQTVYWLLLFLMIWRGIGGGMAGLPWQEINARVIPITHGRVSLVFPAFLVSLPAYLVPWFRVSVGKFLIRRTTPSGSLWQPYRFGFPLPPILVTASLSPNLPASFRKKLNKKLLNRPGH
jgi:hypothetical protein